MRLKLLRLKPRPECSQATMWPLFVFILSFFRVWCHRAPIPYDVLLIDSLGCNGTVVTINGGISHIKIPIGSTMPFGAGVMCSNSSDSDSSDSSTDSSNSGASGASGGGGGAEVPEGGGDGAGKAGGNEGAAGGGDGGGGGDPTPWMDRIDNDLPAANDDSQSTVYLWTLSAVLADVTHQHVFDLVRNAYEANGRQIVQMSVFREKHPNSKSALEQSYHFHVAWLLIMDYLFILRCHFRRAGGEFEAVAKGELQEVSVGLFAMCSQSPANAPPTVAPTPPCSKQPASQPANPSIRRIGFATPPYDAIGIPSLRSPSSHVVASKQSLFI